VIGIGESGSGILHSLEKTLTEIYSSLPTTIRWVEVDVESHPDDSEKLDLSLDKHTVRLLKERSDTQELCAVQEWLPRQMSDNLRSHETGRALRRLILFANLRRIKTRIRYELKRLQKQSGSDLTIYLVGSLAKLTGSGLLADFAHLIRLEAQELGLQVLSLQALLLLPEAHMVEKTNSTERSRLHQVATASLRELNRFQLVFEHPYPIAYLDNETVRDGRLFERVYLIEPHQQNAAGLRNVPLQWGLYPAMTDAILSLSDPSTRKTWEEIIRAVDTRLNEKQQRDQHALYRSLGSFTYVLPVEDLLEALALRFTEELTTTLRQGHLENAQEGVLSLLGQATSPSGVRNTQLIMSIAKMSQLSSEEALSYANEQGLKLANWLTVTSEDAQQKAEREAIHHLATAGITQGVLTSDVMRAPDYASDTRRVLKLVDDIQGRMDNVTSWLKSCQVRQQETFNRQVEERLIRLLNSSGSESPGIQATLDFLQTLRTILKEQRDVVSSARAKRERQLEQLERTAKTKREDLKRAAQTTQTKHPTYIQSFFRGIAPAVALTLVLGGLSLITSDALVLLGAVALGASGLGAWLSHRWLMHQPPLIQRQNQYLAVEQERLSVHVELAYYLSWEEIIERWQETITETHQMFAAWDQSLETLLDIRLPKLRKSLEARIQDRKSIRVRRYLDDPQLEATLYQRFFDAQVLDEAQTRLVWDKEKESWTLHLMSTESLNFTETTFKQAQTALLNMARAYASRVRSLHIAEVMAEGMADRCAPQEVAKEAGSSSEPFIRIRPDLQQDSEACRLVAAQTKRQQDYFDAVLSTLRKPAVQIHTEHLIESSYPHRCNFLASLDVLRLKGLPFWTKAKMNYIHTDSQRRAKLQIFPAETNAARWETMMPKIGLRSVILHPATCLLLENERWALAFLRALACGWIREHQEVRSGLRRYRAIALKLSESDLIMLTEPGDKSPSFWMSMASFVLKPQAFDKRILIDIEKNWKSFIEPKETEARRIARDQLETVLEQATNMRKSPNEKKAQLGMLLQLVSEDGLNRLYGEKALFTQNSGVEK
jgi:hypothetical protein